MFIRRRAEIESVNWGNGTSERLLTHDDQFGFTVAHTVVNAGTVSKLEYKSHLEACYCIRGSGSVRSEDGSAEAHLLPGILYALDQHDRHYLIASETEDLELISIFNPPLRGDEKHALDSNGFSSY